MNIRSYQKIIMKITVSILSLIVLLLFSACSSSLPEAFTQNVDHVIIELYDAEQPASAVNRRVQITTLVTEPAAGQEG